MNPFLCGVAMAGVMLGALRVWQELLAEDAQHAPAPRRVLAPPHAR